MASRGKERTLDESVNDALESVISYHERTKHHPQRYARSPGYLDWANEPEPFRRFEGSILLELPFIEKDREAGHHGLYHRDRNPFHPFTIGAIAAFLELSMGLSAWKSSQGLSWALRIDPSSGNLHPTEAYLVLPPMPETGGLGGVYHYNPYLHALEQRASFDLKFWRPLGEHFGAEGFLVGLSSIPWRESWKYGERAFRYCNQDIGHAMAGLSFSANLLGWKVACLNAVSDSEIEIILGFEKAIWERFEEEYPSVLLFVHESPGKRVPGDLPQELIEPFGTLSYTGEPNRLSRGHREWPVIGEVSAATRKPRTPERRYRYRDHPLLGEERYGEKAAEIIRKRRSALAYDGKTSLPREHLFEILDKTIPRSRCAPFDLELGDPAVHLLLFVHRVSGLPSGLYFLFRNERDIEGITARSHARFLWERPGNAPGTLPLFLLEKGDFRATGAMAG